MLVLVTGIHVFYRCIVKDVDCRNKSGHDGAVLSVIASEAKHPVFLLSLDCFVAEPVPGHYKALIRVSSQ